MKRSAAALAALFLFASPAQAQFGVDRAAQVTAADLNHDGQITKAEAEAARVAMFERLDGDHDGFLTAQERAGAGQIGFMMGFADGNHDGRVSRAELMGQPYRGFDRYDVNHDNVVSAAELQAVR